MAKIRKLTNKDGTAWQVDYYDPAGKRVRKCFAMKKDAEAYVGKAVSAKREGRYDDVFKVKKETQVTFAELSGRYVENFGTQRAFESSKRYLLDVVKEYFGDRPLSTITYLDLETYRNKRKATPTNAGKPRTDASVNREMALISHMLAKAVEWELLETSPFKKGKRLMFKENNQRLRFLTHDEIEALIPACTSHLKPIVETALHTGMRRGEILSLKWEQIRNGFIYLKETKSNKARQIPINDQVGQIFRELRLKNQLKTQYVFCGPDGNRLQEVKRSFNSACRRAGIYDFRFHDLRHTFASHLVMNGVGLKAVQELLGHADLKMTMRYAHLSQAHLKDAVAALNNLGNGQKLVKNDSKEKGVNNLSAVNPF
jgi:integrase